MRSLLQEADDDQAQAAVYVYIDGMSQNEAAELLGYPEERLGIFWTGSMRGLVRKSKKNQLKTDT